LQAGTLEQTANVSIANSGGGALSWQASMAYTSGAGWLSISPSKGFGNSTLGTIAIPRSLTPGTYTGTLTVDGGPIAGFAASPVTLNLAAPPAPSLPSIGSVLSAASFLPEPVVPGSLVTIMGSLFGGSGVSVMFNNLAGTVVFSNATQINVLVPSALSGQTAANLVVTVDGASSAPLPVMVAPFEPGIFSGGIVNEDGSVNNAAHAAAAGSVIAMWGTGLSGNGTITANIGGQNIAAPYYAGPAPGIPGVQQVNLIVPAGLAPGATQVYVCGTVSGGSPVCSIPSPLTIK
jgi:uncharacterized protein (TIGR03437 family)